MRLGFIADIHANAPALAATLRALDLEGVDRVLALGDLIGYHAMPHETLALLRDRHIPSVAGNHDLMALGRLPSNECGPRARGALEWTRAHLTAQEVAELASLPEAIRPAPQMLCVHATLGDPTRRLHSPEEILAERERLGAREPGVTVCLMGHDHRAYVHAVGPTVVTIDRPGEEIPLPRRGFAFVNPGSVGEARDGQSGASFAVFDSQRWSVTLRRVAYDHDAIAAADAAAQLPPLAPAPDDDPDLLRRLWQLARRFAGGNRPGVQ